MNKTIIILMLLFSFNIVNATCDYVKVERENTQGTQIGHSTNKVILVTKKDYPSCKWIFGFNENKKNRNNIYLFMGASRTPTEVEESLAQYIPYWQNRLLKATIKELKRQLK